MWEIALIILFFLIVIGILTTNIIYKNHCIDDLEKSKKNIISRKNEEFLKDLKKLMSYQSFEQAGRETCTRNFLEDCIEKYSKNESNTRFER